MTEHSGTAQKQWGGRFASAADPLLEQFSASVHYDARLAIPDIRGSIAHARMLGQQGIITPAEAQALLEGLHDILTQVEAGIFSFNPALEDIHTNIEAALRERLGDVAGKLHTARSRNDQVALDLRLFLREASIRTLAAIADLQQSLIEQASATADMVMPGFTHLQPAQPVTAGHHLMAYVTMLERDAQRLRDGYTRINILPLGVGALAGVPYPIDRQSVATELGFAGVSENSMDTVADRDSVIEYTATVALLMVHLSRLCEEIILWTTEAMGYWELDDAFATGSSIMPQKKNPDVAELVRGKSGRVIGHLTGLLVMMKGLPLTYNRDLQEDKEALFDTVDTVLACLTIMAPFVASLRPRPDRMLAAAGNLLCATDIADYLAMKGMPFRQAHEVTGRIVRRSLESGRALLDLPLDEYRALSPLFSEDIYQALTPQASTAARQSEGGTAPVRVREQIAAARARLADARQTIGDLSRSTRPTSPEPLPPVLSVHREPPGIV